MGVAGLEDVCELDANMSKFGFGEESGVDCCAVENNEGEAAWAEGGGWENWAMMSAVLR